MKYLLTILFSTSIVTPNVANSVLNYQEIEINNKLNS